MTEPASAYSGASAPPRILIVEDEFLSSNLLAAYLQDFGTCEIAIDGEEARSLLLKALAEGKPYDLVFLDLILPRMDGRTVLRELRAREAELGLGPDRETQVVIVSALSELESSAELAAHRVAGFISKPYTRSRIQRELRRFLPRVR